MKTNLILSVIASVAHCDQSHNLCLNISYLLQTLSHMYSIPINSGIYAFDRVRKDKMYTLKLGGIFLPLGLELTENPRNTFITLWPWEISLAAS